ncbi:MAG: ribbon-helix-helix protein, CopG family [Sulfolobales archaeon]
MRVITFKLDEETVSELNKVASKLGISRSEVIRAAILNYVNDYINKETNRKTGTRRILLK